MKPVQSVAASFTGPRTLTQVPLLKANHMRRHIIMFPSGSLDAQRTVEVRKERKYSRTALGVMSAKLLSFVMTATRNCSTIQCSYLKTSNDSRKSFGAKDFLKIQRPSRERGLLEESNCFMKSSTVDLK